MIEAKDLRIGNIVNDEDLQPMYIAGLWPVNYGKQYNFIDSAGNAGNINLLTGILLTEEWLLKFGFERMVDLVGKSQIEYIDYRMDQFVCFLLPKKGLEIEFWAKHNNIDQRGYLTTLQYVHQLQNLYHALTGQELSLTQQA